MSEIVIFDEDKDYIHSLMEYLQEEKGLLFKTVGFSDYDRCVKYLSEKGADLLLAQGRMYEKFKDEEHIGKCLLLSEGMDTVSESEKTEGEENITAVYKYQAAPVILEEILHYYSEVVGETAVNTGKRSNITAVYSPVSRCGKTSFSLAMGQVLACENRVLYLNLEEFSGMEEILNMGFDNDLSDLMYHFRLSPDSIGTKLRKYIRNLHGMDFIPPLRYVPDIRNVDVKYWKKLILAVSGLGVYDEIILDFSNMVGDVISILEICDRIYMPIRNDRLSMLKINDYEKYILMSENEELLEKTVKIMLPLVEGRWDDDYIEQIVWGEMGEYVRKLLEERVA